MQFYDFGMMGEIVPGVRERLLDMFYGVYRKDTQVRGGQLCQPAQVPTTVCRHVHTVATYGDLVSSCHQQSTQLSLFSSHM